MKRIRASLAMGVIAFIGPAVHAADPATDSIPVHLWPEYQNHDFHGLAARLRAENYPVSLLRIIVGTALDEYFAPRRRGPAFDGPAYWQNEERYRNRPRQDPESSPQAIAAREQNALAKEVLGPDSFPPVDHDNIRRLNRRDFGFESEEKGDELRALADRYRGPRNEIGRDRSIAMASETGAKLLALEREMRPELERILTSSELAEYEIRRSWTSEYLRSRLRWFDVTEAEFREMYAARRAFDQKYTVTGAAPAGRQLALQELENRYREVLGDARFAEFKASAEKEDGMELARRPQPPPPRITGPRVTLHLFSGRTPPMFAVADPEMRRLLDLVAKLPDDTPAAAGSADPFRFGRWLFSLENIPAELGYKTLRVAETTVELRHFTPELGPGSTAILKRDEGRLIETELLRLAQGNATLPADVIQFLNARLAAPAAGK